MGPLQNKSAGALFFIIALLVVFDHVPATLPPPPATRPARKASLADQTALRRSFHQYPQNHFS